MIEASVISVFRFLSLVKSIKYDEWGSTWMSKTKSLLDFE